MKQARNRYVWAGMAIMAMILTFGCSSQRIGKHGLAFARLGQAMPRVETLGDIALDTLFSENGFQWRAICIEQDGGTVWVEESFDQSGLIGRIRVESEAYALKKRVRVGQSADEILPKGKDWHFRAYPEYALIEASCAQFPHTYFLFTAPNLDFSNISYPITFQDLGMDAQLEKIVVM